MDKTYYTTIGMDVSDRTTKVCVMAKERGARRIVEETTISTTKDGLRAYLAGRPIFYCLKTCRHESLPVF